MSRLLTTARKSGLRLSQTTVIPLVLLNLAKRSIITVAVYKRRQHVR